MTEKELQMLLAKASIIDKRNVDRVTLLHWGEILGDITYLEANAALVQVRRTIDPKTYLVPSHITRIVYGWREEHAKANPDSPGTYGLVYVSELRKYLYPHEVDGALAAYQKSRGISQARTANKQNGEITDGNEE